MGTRMEACGRGRRQTGLHEKTEVNCREAGIFSLQAFLHPGSYDMSTLERLS